MKIYKTPYFWRSYLAYALFIMLGTGLVGVQQAVSISDSETDKDLASLHAQGALLAVAAVSPLRTVDRSAIEDLTSIIAVQTGLRVTVILPDGKVLADTLEDVSVMENHLQRPEVQLAISRGAGDVERYSQTLNRNFVYRTLAVRDNNSALLGVVRVARAREDLNRFIHTRQLEVLENCLLVLGMLLLVAFAQVWRKTAIAELLTETAEAIARGDFERRVPEAWALGMKRLADAINQMARNSAKRMSTLTSERNRLAIIFTGMVEGVIDIDEKQNIVHINEAAVQLLGLQNDKYIGKPVWQEIRNQKITQALDEVLLNRSVIKTRVDFLRGSQQLVIDLYVASLADNEGNPIGAILVLHDVTGLTRLERIRTDFVANASHELKTPITAIQGLSETMVSDPDVDRETLMRFMVRIHAQSIRLSQLVVDLMIISRLEADSDEHHFSRINMVELTAKAIATANHAAEIKHQQLSTQLSAEQLEVFGDRQNLSQLLDNLIDNAIKYTPDFGRITIRLRREHSEVVLEVEDSGIGISPQYQERIFERFYRIDKARSQSLGGTGLGLSIVRNITEQHAGTIGVFSQPGKGSVFTFRMPLALETTKSSS